MKLVSIEFSEFQGQPNEWTLDNSAFGDINLVVGKNSSGKTRLLNVINGLALLLAGKRRELYGSAQYKVVLECDNCERYVYELSLKERRVESEKFRIGRKVLLSRSNDGTGTIEAVQLKKKIRFQAPETELAAVSRRDSIQHPFFEELHSWATSVKHYLFGSDLGKKTVSVFETSKDEPKNKELAADDPEQVVKIVHEGLKMFGKRFSNAIVRDMKQLGYPCEEIGLINTSDIIIHGIPATMIYIKEEDLESETTQIHMSQGMFRVVSLLSQLNYNFLSKTPVFVLIDDIGEGLDFSRSSAMIQLLIKKAKRHRFQLIMTTNDRFIMNGVPLEYWSVIERDRNKVSIINKKTSPKVFKDFGYVGLNNFDFFASDFYKKGLQ